MALRKPQRSLKREGLKEKERKGEKELIMGKRSEIKGRNVRITGLDMSGERDGWKGHQAEHPQ